MRHLTTAQGSFHARVLAARLGAEGILVDLRGMSEGPYPIQGAVDVFVSASQLELGREILLADAVDAAVDGDLVELEELADLDRFDAGLWALALPPAAQPDPARDAHLAGGPVRVPPRAWPGALVTLALVIALVVVGLVAVSA